MDSETRELISVVTVTLAFAVGLVGGPVMAWLGLPFKKAMLIGAGLVIIILSVPLLYATLSDAEPSQSTP